MSNTTEKKEKQSFGQFIKFALFSASAGIIQVLTFTLLSEVVIKPPAIQSAMESNATFARIMQNEYGPMYLTALILSVVWNFTFNRKFTFKSAANVPVAMLKVFAFYLVFTPISTLLGNYFTAKFADVSAINYIVLGLTMATNMITEFLYDKFVVFRGQENTAVSKRTRKSIIKSQKDKEKRLRKKCSRFLYVPYQSSICKISSFERTPTARLTVRPSRITSKVGILAMPKAWASSGCSSTFTLPTLAPVTSAPISSTMGDTIRHGPHQVAQNPTAPGTRPASLLPENSLL